MRYVTLVQVPGPGASSVQVSEDTTVAQFVADNNLNGKLFTAKEVLSFRLASMFTAQFLERNKPWLHWSNKVTTLFTYTT